jgi:hypothetical protein
MYNDNVNHNELYLLLFTLNATYTIVDMVLKQSQHIQIKNSSFPKNIPL